MGYEISLTKIFYDHVDFQNITTLNEKIDEINDKLKVLEKKL